MVVPSNYRVKGIKKDIISPHQHLTVLRLPPGAGSRVSAFTGPALISVTQQRNLEHFQSDQREEGIAHLCSMQ